MSVAIVIPTLNRPAFLKRAMSWYNRPECKDLGLIIIDSSPEPSMRKINFDIVGARGKYIETPELYDPQTNTSAFGVALEMGGRFAQCGGYKYILHAGDDDFILPDGIKKCVKVMDSAPETVVGCVGKRVKFGMKGATGQPVTAQVIEYPNLNSARLQDRLINWFRASFTLQFAAVRIETWRKAHMDMAEMPTWYFGNEIFPNIHTLCQGKIVKVPETSVAFQVNPDRQFGFDRWALYDLVVKDKTFSKTMAESRFRLQRDFGDETLKLFDDIFMEFLANSMVKLKGNNEIRYDGLQPVDAPEGLESVWEVIKNG